MTYHVHTKTVLPQEHLSDHELDEGDVVAVHGIGEAVGEDERHDAEIVRHHKFGHEHDQLLHQLNVLQCCILVGLDSVSQHASLHEHAGSIDSLAVVVSTIPAFTSRRLCDYVVTLVHLVRQLDDDEDPLWRERHGAERRRDREESTIQPPVSTDLASGEGKADESKTETQQEAKRNSHHHHHHHHHHGNQVVTSFQLQQIVRVLNILVQGSHELRRKFQTHASEEIRFYLCQPKFISNIRPKVLYNMETLRLLWELLWNCLEAHKTADMRLIDRINYRSELIMWSYREIAAGVDPTTNIHGAGALDGAENAGAGGNAQAAAPVVLKTGQMDRYGRRMGAKDHSAHDIMSIKRSKSLSFEVKLKRANRHRKMFPQFYRGELMAPSAESIKSHNALIKKLLGNDVSDEILQTRKHDGTGLFRGPLFDNASNSDSDTAADAEIARGKDTNRRSALLAATKSDDMGSSSSDTGDSDDLSSLDSQDSSDDGGGGPSTWRSRNDTEAAERRRQEKRQRRKAKRSAKKKRQNVVQKLELPSAERDGDATSSSESSDYASDASDETARSSALMESMGLAGSGTSGKKKSFLGRRRSVMARNVVGIGRALLRG